MVSRVVIAAPSTGQGKTTVATGLMAALRSSGLEVSGHKVGPDYIDPGYHALATGRPGRNLDPHLVGEDRVVPLLLHGARGADIAVIEGVMGLYDGRIGQDGFASTAHVAKLTGSPVVLVMDVARMSRTAGAIAAGMLAFDPDVEIAGLILNRAGSARNVAEIERSLSLPVLGVLPRNELLAAPSRHLGLVPVAERDASAELIELMGREVAKHVDLDAVVEVAHRAAALEGEAWDPTAQVSPVSGRPVVAVAGGRAFTFRYPETDELLEAAGCEVATFDPLVDSSLPDGTRAIYLGGGFPEIYAGELASNRRLLDHLRTAVQQGVPTYAECAGLLYLTRTLEGLPMADVVPAEARLSGRLTLGYPVATAMTTFLTEEGERVAGHEFHKTRTTPPHAGSPAWDIDGEHVGFSTPTLHASYLHTHWAGHPWIAQRFANAAATVEPSLLTREPSLLTREPSLLTDPLRHHGDRDAAHGLLDLAVNVYDGPRPAWLEQALKQGIADSITYPDASAAREAISQRYRVRVGEVLPTAGAAEAFTLIARLRGWARPVVVHPQFTEPQAALEQAGHVVTEVICSPATRFALDPDAIPEEADLVIVGNPTNPTGILHPASSLRRLLRPGRLVVVDEAFMDAVPDESESLLRSRPAGLVVLRSLTKHWSIPGIRAGFLVGDPSIIEALGRGQTPWSVSSPALTATIACATDMAEAEGERRALQIAEWRRVLETGLERRGVPFVQSAASFVLAQLGSDAHERLRAEGIAIRRADTFPGLDDSWVRIAVRPVERTQRLLNVLDRWEDRT